MKKIFILVNLSYFTRVFNICGVIEAEDVYIAAKIISSKVVRTTKIGVANGTSRYFLQESRTNYYCWFLEEVEVVTSRPSAMDHKDCKKK